MRNHFIFPMLALLSSSVLLAADDCNVCGAPKVVDRCTRCEAAPKSKVLDFCGESCQVRPEKKCYATIRVPVPETVKSEAPKKVDDCVIIQKKSRVVGQVPVTTYQVVSEWVDAPVIEEYEETIKVPRKAKVAATDDVYQRKDVDGKKKVRTKLSDGEIRECEEPVKNKVGEIGKRNLERTGYFTDEKVVKKNRVVPGKVLKFKRVPITVMKDKIEYYEEKVEAVATKTPAPQVKYTNQRVQVDCETKQQPIDWNTAIEVSALSANVPVRAEVKPASGESEYVAAGEIPGKTLAQPEPAAENAEFFDQPPVADYDAIIGEGPELELDLTAFDGTTEATIEAIINRERAAAIASR